MSEEEARAFEKLLEAQYTSLQRYVRYKIHNPHDAEDILQEVCLTAIQRFATLKRPDSFKAWLISIANHKCQDYYRKKAKDTCLSLDALPESILRNGRMGVTRPNMVRDTLDGLGEKERQILYLYFFENLSQEDLSMRLSLPLGTVKSRLHYAKRRFKQLYSRSLSTPPDIADIIHTKGEMNMNPLPICLPPYTIERSDLPPFPVRWEELQGWLLVPRLGESLCWGLYDGATRRRTEYTEMQVIGKAEVHGIQGVEITAIQYDAENYYRTGSVDRMERRFVAQLTDTHCRYLAESHVEDGVRKLYTFLDGEAFLDNWGFGEDNCGNPIQLSAKGKLHRDRDVIDGHTDMEEVDVVGRYTVHMGGKAYDTICVMDIQCFQDGVASEQYLDASGRTILWRRFNKNDWAYHRYGQYWTELLPDNQRLCICGETYVHWYDCVSDYVFRRD